MSNLNTPDIQTSQNNEIIRQWLTESEIINSTRASERIIKILDKDPNAQFAVTEAFRELAYWKLLRDPNNIQEFQDWLYKARDIRLAQAKPEERRWVLESFTHFMEGFSQNIAYMQRDIWWSNDLKDIQNWYHIKRDSVMHEYEQVSFNHHPIA